jgi:hypothetical protein
MNLGMLILRDGREPRGIGAATGPGATNLSFEFYFLLILYGKPSLDTHPWITGVGELTL